MDRDPSLMFELIKNKQIGFSPGWLCVRDKKGQKSGSGLALVILAGDCISGRRRQEVIQEALSRMLLPRSLLLPQECVNNWQYCTSLGASMQTTSGMEWRKKVMSFK